MNTENTKKYTTAKFEGLFKLDNLNDNNAKFLIYGLGESGKAVLKFLANENVSPDNIYILDENLYAKNWKYISQEFVIPKDNIYCGYMFERFSKNFSPIFDKVIKNPNLSLTKAIKNQEINYVIMAPGVPTDNWKKLLQILAEAENNEKPNLNFADVISEIDIFLWAKHKYDPKSKLVGITGCNGKTTTTALTAQLFKAAGISAIACGNISPPAIKAFYDIQKNSDAKFPKVWVLELSSFQLETTHNLNADSVAILNLEPDHLDRYNNDIYRYILAKTNILQGARSAWFNRSDARTLNFFGAFQIPEIYKQANLRVNVFGIGSSRFDKKDEFADGFIYRRLNKDICQGDQVLLNSADLKLQGEHNISNVMAALALYYSIINYIKIDENNADAEKNLNNLVEFEALSADSNLSKVINALKNFENLPHRVQIVHQEENGTTFIDDSKSTNVASTIAALKQVRSQMPEKALLGLILGGEDKGQDFDNEFYKALQDAKLLRVELIGNATKGLRAMIVRNNEIIKAQNEQIPKEKHIKVLRFKAKETLQDAMNNLCKHIKNQPGSVILLSPACASTDMYKNYKERAEDFVKCIPNALQYMRDLAEEKSNKNKSKDKEKDKDKDKEE